MMRVIYRHVSMLVVVLPLAITTWLPLAGSAVGQVPDPLAELEGRLGASLEAKIGAALEAKLTPAMRAAAEGVVKAALANQQSFLLDIAAKAADTAVRAALPTIEAKVAEINARVQTTIAVEARVATLEAEVRTLRGLEARVAALEARQDAMENKQDQPSRVKAPFIVVDGAGKEILRVEGSGEMELSGAGASVVFSARDEASVDLISGPAIVELAVNATSSRIEMSGTGSTVVLAASQSQGAVTASLSDRKVEMAADSNGLGLTLENAGEQTATLAAAQSGKPFLVMNDGGDLALHAGFGSTGRPSIGLWANGSPAGRMEVASDGSGRVTTFAGGSEAVTLGTTSDGATRGLRVVSPGNSEVFAGLIGDSSPSIWVAEAGAPLAMLSTADNAGSVDLFRADERKIGLSAGPAPGLRVYAREEAAVYAGVGEDGISSLSLSHGGNLIASLGGATDNPASGNLILLDADQPIVSAGRHGAGVGIQVYDGDETAIELAREGGTSALLLSEQGSPKVLVGTSSAGHGEMTVFGEGLAEVASIKELSDLPGSGSLVLSSSGVRQATMQFSQAGKPVIKLLDSGGKVLFGAGVAQDGQSILQLDAATGAGVRMWADAQGSGANVYSGQDLVATINSVDDPGKGILAVYENGVSVARLGVGSNGGGNVTTTDPSGSGVFSAGYVPDGPGLACVERKGTKCLGIGLTGMEGFR